MTDLYTPLLVTKLHIPALRNRWVERQRLLNRLMAQPDAGLVLLSAPPGYGKTSLLADWSHLLTAQKVGVAWFSVEENDNDPLRFWTYAISALQSLPDLARLGENLLGLLRLPEPPPLTNLLSLLINELTTYKNKLVLVLDDYHSITDPDIHAGLVFLLDHLPEPLRIVIASRSTPRLPLPRLRARGKVLELHAQDLRFSPDESARFLNHVMGLNLTPEDTAALEQSTEGWAAGLQLAALSFQGKAHAAPAQRFGQSPQHSGLPHRRSPWAADARSSGFFTQHIHPVTLLWTAVRCGPAKPARLQKFFRPAAHYPGQCFPGDPGKSRGC